MNVYPQHQKMNLQETTPRADDDPIRPASSSMMKVTLCDVEEPLRTFVLLSAHCFGSLAAQLCFSALMKLLVSCVEVSQALIWFFSAPSQD